MSEEEMKAIEWLKTAEFFSARKFTPTILNLIEKQQKEIEELQIIADDIKGHNIVYTDTPEFEDKFISKNKIKEIIDIYDNTHEEYVELPNGKVIDRNYCGYLIEYLQELLEE